MSQLRTAGSIKVTELGMQDSALAEWLRLQVPARREQARALGACKRDGDYENENHSSSNGTTSCLSLTEKL